MNRRHRSEAWILAGLCVLAFVGFSLFSIVRHERLNSSGIDLAIFDQVAWNTAQGRWFASSISQPIHLADHFSPIILLYSQLYHIWSDVRVLLLLQAFALAIGVFPVAWMAQKAIQRPGAGLLFALLYLLYPSIGFMNRFDFHEAVLAVPLLLFALYFLTEDRLIPASFLLGLALLVKEDVGLTVAAIGVYAALVRRKRAFGWAWAGVGLGWSLLATLVFVPHFARGAAEHWQRYAWLGLTPAAMLKTLLTRPLYVLRHQLARRTGVLYPFKILLPLAFTPLLAPEALLMAAPAFVYNWLSSLLLQSTLYYQYMALIVPAVLFAGILAVKRLLGWLETRVGKLTWPLIAATLLACSLVAFALENPFSKPLRRPLPPVYTWETKPNVAEFREASALIPPDASLEAIMAYAPHFSQRQQIYVTEWIVPHLLPPGGKMDYIFLDLRDYRWSNTGKRALDALDQGYGVRYFQNGVLLLEAAHPASAEDRVQVERYVAAVTSGQVSSYH